MNEGMGIGDIVGMTSCSLHQGSKIAWLRTRYNAKRGNRMVFMFMGTEPIEGEELDVIEILYRLGWSNPDFPRKKLKCKSHSPA